MAYNADGHRVQKVIVTGGVLGVAKEYNYLVDSNNPTGYSQVVEEKDGLGSLNRSYHIGHQRFAMTDHFNGGAISYFSFDGHGSIRGLTDENGDLTEEYDFDAYGILIAFRKDLGDGLEAQDPKQIGVLSRNEFLFAGEQWDADMGMYYNRARYYDVENGRFNAMDDWEGRTSIPVTLNKYLYGNGNPSTYIDPSGNFSLVELILVQNNKLTKGAKNTSTAVKATGTAINTLVKASIILNLAVAGESPRLRPAALQALPYNLNLIKEFKKRNPKGALAIKKIPRIAKFIANVAARQTLVDGKGFGIEIKRNGLPDFSIRGVLSSRLNSVIFMPLTGSRSQDKTRAASISRIPANSMYTWHHHEAVGIMMLLDRTAHRKHGHAGGVFFHEILTGKKYRS